MDEGHIPPLLSPDQMPPIRSQDDLHRHWRALMGPLGFSGRQLWLNVLGADRRPTPVLLARPGSAPMSPADRGFARALAAAARCSGVPLEPLHLATDEEVLAFAPDDLAA